ncbi:MAG: glycoside hydrolase family 2 [Acidobacteria bacterium]|nr:MAG: glycoside hydrolase family 2 [Acidobacteriota bacterium]
MYKSLIFIWACVLALACVQAHAQSPSTEIRCLSGTGTDDAVVWDFFCTEGRKSGAWSKIRVPSNWELEGFGDYQYGGDHLREPTKFPKEQGKYRLNFNAPQRWKASVVRLVFEGSMTDTEVWINGRSAGPMHQGSFYRFKYDISSLLKFGEPNLLEITVSKESSNTGVNRAERLGDYWNFGGIFRPVYLEVLPGGFIDWTAIDARADGQFTVTANLDGELSNTTAVSAQLIDRTGIPIGKPFTAKVDSVSKAVTLKTFVVRPKLWTAETPNLYRVRLNLLNGARVVHSVTERFGFRTIEVKKGDGIYVNGQRILLKGANRHSFWPDTGRALNRKISYDDVKLIKEMNMNAVRMSHYPPDKHFLEACDELGLYVLDELAGWQKSYDAPTGRRLIGQIVRRDVNHPSILFWDNGNEGGWNTEVDDEFARWDPQRREVLHPWEKFRLTNTDHYEKFDSHTRLSNGPDIYMPTEFLHGLYDGGIGAGMWDYWELIRKSKVGGGGFLWALVDECVKRTDQNNKLDCAGNRGPDGIVGPYREREGSFNTVREIWSPVQIESVQQKDSAVVLRLDNRYDFTDLNECQVEWTLASFSERVKGHRVIRAGVLKTTSIPPHTAGELRLSLPPDRKQSDVLYIKIKDPAQRELWTWSVELKQATFNATASTRKLERVDNGNITLVRNGSLELAFDKRTGVLARVSKGGRKLPLENGPRFIAYRRNDRKYDSVAGSNQLTHFEVREEQAAIIVESSYGGPLRQVRWRIVPDGLAGVAAELDYQYEFDGVVDMLGIDFDSSDRQFRSVRWLGMGPYRVWQNRVHGTRLDVWENAYNDSTPGESWIFPEFKGYFRGLRWARFETTTGPFSVSAESPDSYLGVFKPRDGVNGLFDLPSIGIAFLDVIPAMRNKFHTTNEIGPQSQARKVSGLVKRNLKFQFGE